MKNLFSYALVLLGVGLLVIGVYNANQYWIQQATVQPSLQQLEKLDTTGLTGVSLDETKQLLTASMNALLQMTLVDVILGLVFLVAGFWTMPSEKGR